MKDHYLNNWFIKYTHTFEIFFLIKIKKKYLVFVNALNRINNFLDVFDDSEDFHKMMKSSYSKYNSNTSKSEVKRHTIIKILNNDKILRDLK